MTRLLVTVSLCAGAAALRAGENPAAALPGTLTLEQAYDRVIGTDQQIAIADYEVRKARLAEIRALTRVMPDVSFGAGSNWRGDRTLRDVEVSGAGNAGTLSGNGDAGTTLSTISRESQWSRTRSHSQSLGLNLRQPLLDLTVGPARRQGELGRRITEWQLRLRLREVLFGVAQQYFEILKQDKLVEEGRKTLGLTNEQLRQAEVRLKAEEVIESDVLQARVDDQRARRAVLESESRLAQARARLGVTLNAGLALPSALTEPPKGKPAAPALTDAVALAQTRREDLEVARLTLHRTSAEREEIEAGFAPTVDFQVSRDLGFGSSIERSESWTAGVSLNWSLFDRGQRQLDLKTNALQISQDGLRIQSALRDVTNEVVNAWYAADRLHITLSSLEIERQAAEANYKVQQAKYGAGLATSLEVQTAIRDLARVRADFVTATYDLEIAWRDLENVLAIFQNVRIDQAMARLLPGSAITPAAAFRPDTSSPASPPSP